jgi:hypothetical protein
MQDRVHYHPILIYSVGTQVVALVEILGQNRLVLHPRGSVGVVVRSPTDLEHPYRVRFPDGIEESLHQDQLRMLALSEKRRLKETKPSGRGMPAVSPSPNGSGANQRQNNSP